MQSKVELKKVTEITGEIWFKLYHNETAQQCFQENRENEAINAFHKMIENEKNGLPKIETILSYPEN